MNRSKVVGALQERGVKVAGTVTLRVYEGGWGRPGAGFLAAWEEVLGIPPGSATLPPRNNGAGDSASQDESAEAAVEPRAA